jgi:hypothetical protein
LFSETFQLVERNSVEQQVLLGLALVGVVMVAMSFNLQYRSLLNLIANFFKLSFREKDIEESSRLSAFANNLLTFNHALSFGLVSYLFLITFQFLEVKYALWIAIGAVLFTHSIQQFGFRILGWITGESRMITEGAIMTRQLWNFSGILFLILVFYWILAHKNGLITAEIFFGILGITLFLRFLKGWIWCFKQGFSWYYYILYLCTLEILPAFMVFYWVVTYFRVGE